MGATPEVLAEARAALEERNAGAEVEIWPEHWFAWKVFEGMCTQWRIAVGGAGVLFGGLDYAALPFVIAGNRGVPHRQPFADTFTQLRVLEATAMNVLNSRTG